MEIIFLGDIIGVQAMDEAIRFVQTDERIKKANLHIANVENVSGGFGLTEENYNRLLKGGFGLFSGGNHLWDKKEIFNYISKSKIARPCNLPSGTPGQGWQISIVNGVKVALINVLGKAFMNINALDCPFRSCDRAIEEVSGQGAKVIIVDCHAEASAEKVALAHYLDGRVSAVLGTHTHVPTADERLLPKGTAFITDVGPCASLHSVIGMSIESALPKFLTGLPSRFEVSKSKPIQINCVKITFDGGLKPSSIERISCTTSS